MVWEITLEQDLDLIVGVEEPTEVEWSTAARGSSETADLGPSDDEVEDEALESWSEPSTWADWDD